MEDWIQDFCKSWNQTLGTVDLNTVRPFFSFMLHPLYSKEWIDKLKLLMKRGEEKQISSGQLSACWPTASSIRAELFYTLIDMKCAKTSAEVREKIADFLWDMAKAAYNKDIHGFESNILRNDEELRKLLEKISPIKADPSVAKLLGRIYNAAYNYVCSLYTDNYMIYGLETEGPYDVSSLYGPNTMLVIKKALNLRPVEVWPSANKFKANSITLYCIYKDVQFEARAVSAHTVFNGDVINNLINFAVEVDGNPMNSFDVLLKLKEELEKACKDQWIRLTNLDVEEQKLMGLKIRNYGMKRVFDAVGMDWQPSQEMMQAVEGKPFLTEDYWGIPENKEEQVHYWNDLLDPRVEFYPGARRG